MGFSRQEYWSGFHFFLQGIFATQGLNSCLLTSPALAGRFFITAPLGKPWCCHEYIHISLLKMYTLSFCNFCILIYSINLKRQWKKEKARTEQWSAYTLPSHDMCLHKSPQCWPSFCSGITYLVPKKVKGNSQHCFKPRIQIVSRVCRALGNWHGRSFCFRYRMNRGKLPLFLWILCVCVCANSL